MEEVNNKKKKVRFKSKTRQKTKVKFCRLPSLYPALTCSKTPTSRLRSDEEEVGDEKKPTDGSFILLRKNLKDQTDLNLLLCN
jgi:hypothetical protein